VQRLAQTPFSLLCAYPRQEKGRASRAVQNMLTIGNGLRDSRRCNQKIVKPSVLDETVDLGETIVAPRAADAPVGHLDQLVLGPGKIGPAIPDQVGVDVHFAHIVADDGDPASFPVV
jgi:hypothetical protein